MQASFFRSGWLALSLAILVAGCSWSGDKKVTPRAHQVRPPLEVPPDLTAPATDSDLSALVGDAGTPRSDNARATEPTLAEVPPALPLAKAKLDSERMVLTVYSDLEQSWRTVGSALERAGFVIESRDRAKNLYSVRYNGQQTGKTWRQRFLSRVFNGKAHDAAGDPLYQLQLEHAGDDTAVRLLDTKGAPLSGETAGRLLDALYQQLK